MLTREDLENDILRKSRDHIPHSLPLVSEEEFNASLVQETLEPYTAGTQDDILGKLGYRAAA